VNDDFLVARLDKGLLLLVAMVKDRRHNSLGVSRIDGVMVDRYGN
ncbi:unnamed protein product, partial [Acidithrix sp. C25]